MSQEGTGRLNGYPSVANGRAEIALLLCCARSRAGGSASDRIEALLRKTSDWDWLLGMTDRHGLSSLFYHGLRNSGCEIPDDVEARLRKRSEERVRQNLYLTGELLSLLRLFATHGIDAIPWKGPTLAARAYGNVGLREFGDLDILLRRRDVKKAGELLQSKDYDPSFQLSAKQEEAYLESYDEYAFVHRRTGVMVELHWAIAPKAYSFRLGIDRLWERPAPVVVGGAAAPGMAPEYLLLTLCVHGSKHGWERVSLVCDISEMVAACELDWGWLRTSARATGAERRLLLALLLAHELFEANVPESILADAVADRHVAKLARDVEIAYFSRESTRSDAGQGASDRPGTGSPQARRSLWRAFAFHLAAMDRFSDRIRYLASYVGPKHGEWAAVSLPDVLFPIYYLIRPLRLVSKYGLRALKGRTGA